MNSLYHNFGNIEHEIACIYSIILDGYKIQPNFDAIAETSLATCISSLSGFYYTCFDTEKQIQVALIQTIIKAWTSLNRPWLV